MRLSMKFCTKQDWRIMGNDVYNETVKRCYSARQEADWWASEHPNATDAEIEEEANNRYISFYEKEHFIAESHEVIELIKKRES